MASEGWDLVSRSQSDSWQALGMSEQWHQSKPLRNACELMQRMIIE